jgi:hypothetical protein
LGKRRKSASWISSGPRRDSRLLPLVVRIGYMVYPTLSLKSLLEFWDAKPEQVTVRLGDAVIVETDNGARTIPINNRGEFLINYRHSLDDCNARSMESSLKPFLRYAKG